jgi:Flp pilus assembly protein TadB
MKIMLLETILTLLVMYVMTILFGQWMVVATPLVMAFLVMWMLRKYKAEKKLKAIK